MTVIELRVKLPGGPEGRGEMIAMHLEDVLRRYGWAEVASLFGKMAGIRPRVNTRRILPKRPFQIEASASIWGGGAWGIFRFLQLAAEIDIPRSPDDAREVPDGDQMDMMGGRRR